jgi:hypothetical protein
MHYPENAPAFRLVSLKKAVPLIATALLMMGAAPAAQALHGRSRSAPPMEIVGGTSLLGSYLAGHVARATRDSEAAAHSPRTPATRTFSTRPSSSNSHPGIMTGRKP